MATTGITKVDGYKVTSYDNYFKILASASSGDDSTVRLNSAIDLTEYNYIKVRVADGTSATKYSNFMVGVDTSSSKIYATSCTKYEVVTGLEAGQYLILDVSSLTGKYWIYLTYYYSGSGSYGSNGACVDKILVSKT